MTRGSSCLWCGAELVYIPSADIRRPAPDMRVLVCPVCGKEYPDPGIGLDAGN